MKIIIVALIVLLLVREMVKMTIAIENGAKPMKILTPCFFACVIAVLAKLVGNLLTMV